jgi:EAL domain-containing protein (putative c-di-GMP-specific phosphodiesterase class I)
MSAHNELCQRCEVLPSKLTSNHDVYLSAPVRGTLDKVQSAIEAVGIESHFVNDIVQVSLEKELIPSMAGALRERLGDGELAGTRVLVSEPGVSPTLADFIHMQTLESLIARIQGEEVIDLLEAGRLETYLHPIVTTNESNEVFAYECLTRGRNRNGDIVSPGFLFDTARKADMLFYLDREARTTALRSGAPLAGRTKLFVNFNPTTIYTPEYCLKTTMDVLSEGNLGQEDVVFEVVESDKIDDTDHLLSILTFYRDRGFAVALDDLGSGYNSLTSLSRLQPDYMKLDIDLVRDVDQDPFRQAIVRNLLLLARDLGIRTVAEGIERVGEYDFVRDSGVDYVQGYYFAKPEPAHEVIARFLQGSES